MNWLESKYTLLLSNRLDKFKKKNNNWNFRCPICNDSKKNTRKARGWLLEKNGKTRFFCHNCGASLPFEKFLKRIDVNLYYEFVRDRFTDSPSIKQETVPDFIVKRPNFDIKLKRISQLRHDHPVKQYIDKRMIPSIYHHKIYYAPKFGEWVHSLDNTKYQDILSDEPRLVLPFLDEDGKFYGFQGRSFRKNATNKYITILLDPRKPKLWGLDEIDFSRTVRITEGPIDAMFVDNCLASCGGRLDTNVGGDPVLIYDNEPRSRDTISKIDKAIKAGFRVVIWPSDIPHKDINEMIQNGFTSKQVNDIIDENTFRDLTASLNLINWKRI